MVRDLGRQIEDTVRDINDNVDRIHFLRRRVDDRIHDNRQVDHQDIGELVQREVVTAHAAYQISEVTRESDPGRSIEYKKMTAQLLGRAGGDLLNVGQVDQAERYFEDAARMSEAIRDELREFQRREPSKEQHGGNRYGWKNYHNNSRRLRNRSGREDVEEAQVGGGEKYSPMVAMIVSGVIVLFLIGVPGITGAVVGGMTRSWLSMAGIFLILIGAGWVVFKEIKK